MSKENLINEEIKTFYKEMVIVKGGSRDSIGDPIPPYDELISQDPETYVDFIRLSLSQAIDQTREETIKEVEYVVDRFTTRVDLNNFGKILSEEDRENHPDIIWLKQKLKSLINK